MTRSLLLLLLAAGLASCGVQRPLIHPKDIPEFEQHQQEKRDKVAAEQAAEAAKALQENETATPAGAP